MYNYLNFPPLRMLAKLYVFSWKRVVRILAWSCIRLALNQPEQKLVGVVAAAVEAASLQQKTVLQLLLTVKANRSHLSSSFSLGQASLIALTPHVYRTTHQARWQHGGRPLSVTDFVASSPLRGSEWRLTSWGQATSAELPDGRTDKCNFSLMIMPH